MNRYLFSALLFCSPCLAFDPSLLANDKEAETHAYKPDAKVQADARLKAIDPSFKFVGDAFEEFQTSVVEVQRTSPCEWALLQSLMPALQKLQPQANAGVLQDLLVAWRSKDWIDDLMFEIVMNALKLDRALQKPVPSQRRAISVGLTEDQMKRLFAPYRRASRTQPGCSMLNWTQTTDQIAQLTRTKSTRVLTSVLAEAHAKYILTDEAFDLLVTYNSVDVQDWGIHLDRYLSVLDRSKNHSRPAPARAAELEKNEMSSEIPHRHGNTYRFDLYSKFNATQINLLSDLLKKTFERTDATRADVVFQLSSGTETIPVSPMGQYYLARKLLKKDMLDLQASALFAGTSFDYEDIVTAALETGLVTASLLDSALKIDDLWNPKVESWKKFKNYGAQVVGTGTLFLPPPFNMISSIGLVLVSGFIQKRKQVRTEESYEIF